MIIQAMRDTRVTSARRIVTLFCAALVVLAGSSAASPGTGDYAVVVNAANTYKADTGAMKQVIKQLYLKERTDWPNKVPAKPFGRPLGSPEHRTLVYQIMGMTDSQLAAYWLSLKQRSGETAPSEIDSDVMVLKLVARYPGAFAIVKKDAAQSEPGIAILFTMQ